MTPNEAATAGGGGGGHWRGGMTDGYSDYSGRQNNGIQLNIDIINQGVREKARVFETLNFLEKG